MMKTNLSKNYIYNLIYQILAVIIPIILMPYLSRILGPSGVGVYSFTYSITTYFSAFALLGVHLYGTKMISVSINEPYQMKKTFWEIYTLKIYTSVIALIAFYMMSLWMDHQLVFFAQGIWIIGNLVDITWYYMGSEKFKTIVIRNSILKLLTLVFVFVFVKSPNDVWLYAIILSGADLIAHSLLWIDIINKPFVQRLAELKGDFHPLKHIKGTLLLFLPQAIILLYTTLNVTMIGLLSNDTQVGFFDSTAKIINTMLLITTSLGVVMVPRISQLKSEGHTVKIKDLLQKSVLITTYLAYPMMIGLFVLGPIFVPWFFGSEFSDATIILLVLTVKVVIVSLSNIVGIQYMIPTDKNKAFTLSVSLGAIFTLILNIIFIPLLGALGAVIVHIGAELLVLVYQIYLVRKEIPFLKYVTGTYQALISALIMGLVIYFLKATSFDYLYTFFSKYLSEEWTVFVNLSFMVGTGLLVYLALNGLFKTYIQKEIVTRILSKFKRKSSTK